MDDAVIVIGAIGKPIGNAWVILLQKMYCGWAKIHDCESSILYSCIDENNDRNIVVMQIFGPDVHEQLINETGIHAYTTIYKSLRTTVFANVDILPNKISSYEVSDNLASPSRRYVETPYTMVKDYITNVETEDISSVLDGNIDIFIGVPVKG